MNNYVWQLIISAALHFICSGKIENFRNFKCIAISIDFCTRR
jgi:hypothetical protein